MLFSDTLHIYGRTNTTVFLCMTQYCVFMKQKTGGNTKRQKQPSIGIQNIGVLHLWSKIWKENCEGNLFFLIKLRGECIQFY